MPALKKTPLQDLEATRVKLIEAGAVVFAERGFQNATVRDICHRAGANIAAVNYHFGDKLGLYSEILKWSACQSVQAEITAAMQAGDTPEQTLRSFARAVLAKSLATGEVANHIKLMIQELADPSPGLDVVVETLIRPRYKLLSGVVSSLINRPATDKATRLCVHSFLGQVTHYVHAKAVISRVWPELSMTPDQLDEIANHIVRFTLAGFQAVSRQARVKTKTQRKKLVATK